MELNPAKIMNLNHVIIISSILSAILGAVFFIKGIISLKRDQIEKLSSTKYGANLDVRNSLIRQKYEYVAGICWVLVGFIFQFLNNIGSTVKMYAPSKFVITFFILLLIFFGFYLLTSIFIDRILIKQKGETMKSGTKTINLVPRWCYPGDTQMGWVILASNIQKEIGVKHLQYVRIKHGKKKIYCKVMGPGALGHRYLERTGLSDEEKMEIIKESIFMDSYYKQRLGIRKFYSQKEKKVEKIELEMKKIRKIIGPLLASLHHPNDGVKAGTWLGLILGSLSIILALISISIAIF